MLSQENISKYGGKAAILNYVKEKLPHLNIPNYVVKEKESKLSSIVSDFNEMVKPVIVRSSSPFEYGDFEGIFDSIKNVTTKEDLKRAIQEVEQSTNSERANKYAKQNNFQIDNKIHTIIQEQKESEYIGGILRHPNDPDKIYLGFRTDKGMYKNDNFTFVFDESLGKFIEGDFEYANIDEKSIRIIIDNYKEIEGLKKISEEKSLFVECNLNPFSIFQVRPFKKIETADFELPFSKLKNKKYFQDYKVAKVCFGITPPEGIVFPVLKSVGMNEVLTILPGSDPFAGEYFKLGSQDHLLRVNLENSLTLYKMNVIPPRELIENSSKTIEWHNKKLDEKLGKPYCFITSSIKNDNFDTDLSVPNAKAIVVGSAQNFLMHNPLRLIKKADVSVLCSQIIISSFYKNISSLEDKVRIISNGKEAIVMKE